VEGPRYSFVLPVYNEEDTLPELYGRLTAVIESLDGPAELVFVDDGSTDDTRRILDELRRRDTRVMPLRLARNFGHQFAITAGIDHARGDAIVIMDADLQDPPEVIPDLIRGWRAGYDVIYAVRERREGESWLKRETASAFYRLLRRFAETDLPVDAGDFRLIDRRAAVAFRSLPERNRYVRGMFSWIGFRQTGVTYTREERFAGEPKYSYRKSLRLALDGMISFSLAPLRIALILGFGVALVTFVLGLFAIVTRFAGVYSIPGWASIVVVVSFVGGVQLILTGVVGLYVGRMFNEVKARPLYILDEASYGDDQITRPSAT
jgi:polyisoprenyl-phosphate glycosyltransferase